MVRKKLDEESIYHVARKIEDVHARAEYLDQICDGDDALHGRIKALLDADDEETDFLKSVDGHERATVDHVSSNEKPGSNIGRYKLMEQIGEGGMGTVFVAQQEKPIRRKVALKVIKPGMDSKAVIARFEAERQALAMMDHPNIAKVLDAGTTESGHPYFAMELVKGVPITEYCDRNKLTIRERLVLFNQVCHAIQHAHQKGIIHRDIKPSNLLVTLHDGKPVPKVIDFGVAKALNARLTDKTIYTEHLQVVGTLLYMSPEQAELSGLDVDTRSDIYSLGVLLYELLTGTTPFQKSDLDQAGFDEQRRMIRDKEPPRASVRISSLGETLTTVAEHRQTEAKKLGQLVRRDLDWVVLKSLDKDRTRRYDTAVGFAKDVDRYLSDEPVEARPPSFQYRCTKFVKRNRAGVVVGAVFAMLCVAAFYFVLWKNAELGEEQKRTERAMEQAEQEANKKDSAILKKDETLESLAGVLFDQGINHAFARRLNDAEKALDDLRVIPNSEDRATLLESFLMIADERHGEAISKLQSVLDKDRNSVAAHALLTYAYEGSGDIHKFFECHQDLATMKPSKVEEYFFKGMNYGVDPQIGVELITEAISRRNSPVFYLFRGRLQSDWAMQTGKLELIEAAEKDFDKVSAWLGFEGNAGAEAFRTMVTLVYAAKQSNDSDKIQRLIEKALLVARKIEPDTYKGYWNRLFLANLYYANDEPDRAKEMLKSAVLEKQNFATPFYFYVCYERGVEPARDVFSSIADSEGGYPLCSRMVYWARKGDAKRTREIASKLLETDSSIDCDLMVLCALSMIGEDRTRLRHVANNIREKWSDKKGSMTRLERGWFIHLLEFFESDASVPDAADKLVRAGEESNYPNFHLVFYHCALGDYFLGRQAYDEAKGHYQKAFEQHVLYSTGYWHARAMLWGHPKLNGDQTGNTQEPLRVQSNGGSRADQ